MRRVLLHIDEYGYWIAEVPSLPGCHTFGETRDEALEKVQEAIAIYIAALERDHLPVPDDDQNVE